MRTVPIMNEAAFMQETCHNQSKESVQCDQALHACLQLCISKHTSLHSTLSKRGQHGIAVRLSVEEAQSF
jgi:hypothetical protein